LKQGDRRALERLWDRYFERLVRLAQARLRHGPRPVEDEEDAALSVFDSLCRGAEKGRFPRLTDREELWKLLVVITARKVADQVNRERRVKRGGDKVLVEVDLAETPGSSEGSSALEQIISREPTPEFAAQVAEEYERLLNMLDDDQLREIAILRMEGYTMEEIAAKVGCVARTVRRRLGVIRKRWENEVTP
jgi:RNA polymerase sigma factor (sigma-70 family)